MKITKFIFAAILILILVNVNAYPETLADLHQSIYTKGIYIDQHRFPTTVLTRFFNEYLIELVCQARTNESDATIELTADSTVFEMPSDFYLIEAVLLNPDPDFALSSTNKWEAMKFIPRRDFGKSGTYKSGRPEQYSIWNDSIRFETPSEDGEDTVIVSYFRYPRVLVDDTNTVDIPDNYLHLLKEYVRLECLFRIKPGGPGYQMLKEDVRALELRILGRPEDER